MFYNATACLMPNIKLHWNRFSLICETEKYKPIHSISIYTKLINITAEENTKSSNVLCSYKSDKL